MPRLTPQEVVTIREYHASGHTIASLARTFDVAESTVARVVHRKSHQRVLSIAGGQPPLEDPGTAKHQSHQSWHRKESS